MLTFLHRRGAQRQERPRPRAGDRSRRRRHVHRHEPADRGRRRSRPPHRRTPRRASRGVDDDRGTARPRRRVRARRRLVRDRRLRHALGEQPAVARRRRTTSSWPPPARRRRSPRHAPRRPSSSPTRSVSACTPRPTSGRHYRDLLGRVNQIWAAAADRSLLLVAGRALAAPRPADGARVSSSDNRRRRPDELAARRPRRPPASRRCGRRRRARAGGQHPAPERRACAGSTRSPNGSPAGIATRSRRSPDRPG